MHQKNDHETFQRLAEANEYQSWADFGSCTTRHELLRHYIANYTYSVGCIREQEAKYITRAYPTVMTQLYFEFCGDLSEVKDSQGKFAFDINTDSANTAIQKRTYIKQGLGSWFDIYQLPSERKTRPVKNLKIDLFPNSLYQLFQLSPQEIAAEDLQLTDLIGATRSGLMLEEMEAAETGKDLVEIAENYFLDHVLHLDDAPSKCVKPEIQLPSLGDTLVHQATRYNKSERWLQKHYAKVYGMSFKQMQSNLRFYRVHQAMAQAISKHQPINLTELAYHFGYFDQAHFIKHFKKYSGMTPGQYLRTNTEQESQYLFYW